MTGDFTHPVLRVDAVTYTLDAEGREHFLDRRTILPGEHECGTPAGAELGSAVNMIQINGHLFGVPTTSRVENLHDDAGRISRVRCYDSMGRRVSEIVLEYQEGQVRRMSQDDGVAEVLRIEDGPQTETIVRLHGVDVNRSQQTRDARGLVVEEIERALSGPTRRMTYTYVLNTRGDWIERLTFIDGARTPSVRTVRTITYAL